MKQGAPREGIAGARLRKETALADLRQLEVRRLRGELVEVAQVKEKIFNSTRAYRDAWLNWPSRVAAVLAAGWGVDAGRVHRDLEDAVRAHLTELADLTVAGAFD